MSSPIVASTRVRRTIQKSAWLAFTTSALVWSACGETRKNSKANAVASTTAGGSAHAPSDMAAATGMVGPGVNAGGTGQASAAAPSSSSATASTGVVEPGSGGTASTAGTDQGAAGADPAGAGGTGTGGSMQYDDDCEIDSTSVAADVCQVTLRCSDFLQHVNCRSYAPEQWQCDSDEHESSEPDSAVGNPFWYSTVTGTATAAAACDAVVAVNLKRPSVTAIDTADCSEFTAESQEALTLTRLCGPRYEASSGAIVWDGLAASALCRVSEEDGGQVCQCTGLGSDDGEYRLEAPDLAAALADVWEFCTNSSPAVPVDLGECDPVANSSGSDGSCEFIDYCPLIVTDSSGLELEEIVYREIICGPDAAAEDLSCACRVGVDRQLSFRGSASDEPGVSGCEALAAVCDPRNPIERADGPAECERLSEFFGRDSRNQSYSCSVPISLAGKAGLSLEHASLECTDSLEAVLSCTCHDYFSEATTSFETSAVDLTAAWEVAVGQCETLLEAASGE